MPVSLYNNNYYLGDTSNPDNMIYFQGWSQDPGFTGSYIINPDGKGYLPSRSGSFQDAGHYELYKTLGQLKALGYDPTQKAWQGDNAWAAKTYQPADNNLGSLITAILPQVFMTAMTAGIGNAAGAAADTQAYTALGEAAQGAQTANDVNNAIQGLQMAGNWVDTGVNPVQGAINTAENIASNPQTAAVVGGLGAGIQTASAGGIGSGNAGTMTDALPAEAGGYMPGEFDWLNNMDMSGLDMGGAGFDPGGQLSGWGDTGGGGFLDNIGGSANDMSGWLGGDMGDAMDPTLQKLISGASSDPSLMDKLFGPVGGGMRDMVDKLGSGGTKNLLSILGRAAPGLIGMYGANQMKNAAQNQASTLTQYGAPSRSRYEGSYAPGFDITQDPALQKALAGTSDVLLRQLSTQGNPYGNPGGLMEANKYLMSQVALPYLQNYRAQNATTGGYVPYASGVPGAMQGATNATGNIWNAAGATAADVLNPPKSMEDIWRMVNGGFSGQGGIGAQQQMLGFTGSAA